jgi:hypothetical protein
VTVQRVVTGPPGEFHARHHAFAVKREVGSYAPRTSGPKVSPRSIGESVRTRRTSGAGTAIETTHRMRERFGSSRYVVAHRQPRPRAMTSTSFH